MDLPESVVTHELDQIINRSSLRIEQHRADLEHLPKVGPDKIAAVLALKHMIDAFERLKTYRSKFT